MYMLSEVALWMMEYIGSSLILICIQSDIKQELHIEMATGLFLLFISESWIQNPGSMGLHLYDRLAIWMH